MHRTHRIGVGWLVLALFVSGCYGPFNLTRRLYQWNGQVSQEKWGKEIVFLLLAVTPVYSFATLADGIVFNSLEFWTGNNPVDPPAHRHGAAPQSRRVARGDDEALVTYSGDVLTVRQFHKGAPAGGFQIQQQASGAVSYDSNGRLLLTSETLPDGSVLLRNAEGRRVASYSTDDLERLLASQRR